MFCHHLKLGRTGKTGQNSMDKSCQPLKEVRERYWIMRQCMGQCILAALTIGMVINIKLKLHTLLWQKSFHHCLGNITELIVKVFISVSVNFHHRNLITKLLQRWTLKIKDVHNFIQTSHSTTRKPHLKRTYEVSSEVLKNQSSGFIFGQYYLQAIDFIKFKAYKPFVQQSRRKSTEKLQYLFFDSKFIEFIKIARRFF